MKVTVTKEAVLAAILERLQQRVKSWQLVSIYNGLAECSVLEMNDETGEIECDEDDSNLPLAD